MVKSGGLNCSPWEGALDHRSSRCSVCKLNVLYLLWGAKLKGKPDIATPFSFCVLIQMEFIRLPPSDFGSEFVILVHGIGC